MSKQPQKPTGQIGPLRISTNVEFQPIAFPTTKEEIETFIVNAFLKDAQSRNLLPFTVTNHKQNEVDDFDYSLETSQGNKYLELMEIAPLEKLRGVYDKAANSYKPYNFARFIFDKVMGKSNRYPHSIQDGIYLLLYMTHWAFILSESALALLQYWTAHKDNGFEGIFCYSPIDRESGITHLIYPTPTEFWAGFNPDQLRENIAHNMLPLKWNSSNG